MITVYSEKHRLHAPKGEIFGGELVTPFESPFRADLILVNADPLHSVGAVSHSSGVMVRGRWLSRGTLEELLDDIRASYGG